MSSSLQLCEQDDQPNTAAFLSHILPANGQRCIGVKSQTGGFQNFFGDTDEWAAATASRIDQQGADVYYGCASYKAAGSRKADNVQAVRALWLDIDAGEGKPYANAGDAGRALFSFIQATGMPSPTLVKSGGGLHVYWTLTRDITPSDWLRLAVALKTATQQHNLAADPSRTADMASVLRPIGTTNRKRGKLVELVTLGQPSDLATIARSLAPYMAPASGLGPRPGHVDIGMNSDLAAGMEYPDSFSGRIADQCRVVKRMRDTRGNVDQPTWYGVIGVLAHCVDGEDSCHEWSNGHPDYSPAETARKISQALKFGATTCAKLSEGNQSICQACPHAGAIKSPIQLGRAAMPAPAGTSMFGQAAGRGLEPSALPTLMDETQAVGRMNAEFAFVGDWGGCPTHVRWTADGLTRLKTSDLRQVLANRYVQTSGGGGETKRVPAFDFWNHHAGRCEFNKVVYEPEGLAGAGNLNLWRGLARTGRRGAWSKMRRHLLEVVCAGSRDHFRYLIQWLAHAVQHPGTAPGTVPILKSGPEGTGKSIVGGWVCSLFGVHGAQFNSPGQLVGKFNSHLETLSFIVVNEPSFAGDHETNRKLKSMISDPTWTVEVKHGGVYQVPNLAHIMFTTNEHWAVMAGERARRFFVLEVSDKRAGDHRYFANLADEADSGGIEAMLGFLLKLDISKFSPVRDLPATEGLRTQQAMSAPPLVKWARDLITNDGLTQPGGGTLFGSFAPTATLHQDYVDWAKVHQRGGAPETLTAFSKWFAKLGLQATKPGGRRGYDLPDVETFSDAVDRVAGVR
jgi:hypothetical protein